jgi:hypothetical protein
MRDYPRAMLHILYENSDWLPPLTEALARRSLPYALHLVDSGHFDIQAEPPRGVYVNRMSPSAHTRGHGDGVVFVREYLSYLERWGRRVVNGSAAFALEVSKARQHAALERAGVLTPHTVAVAGTRGLGAAARTLPLPFITKHNQGGKGLGVQLFRDLESFDTYAQRAHLDPPFDGITLLQAYVEPPEPYITRVEIVDGRFLYALRASTVGGFELCPADACQVGDAFCPAGEMGKFGVAPLTASDPLVQAYLAFCRTHAIDAAGIEYVEGRDGRRYTYDVNMNTNYNTEVEAAAGVHGMDAWAALCQRLLDQL